MQGCKNRGAGHLHHITPTHATGSSCLPLFPKCLPSPLELPIARALAVAAGAPAAPVSRASTHCTRQTQCRAAPPTPVETLLQSPFAVILLRPPRLLPQSPRAAKVPLIIWARPQALRQPRPPLNRVVSSGAPRISSTCLISPCTHTLTHSRNHRLSITTLLILAILPQD